MSTDEWKRAVQPILSTVLANLTLSPSLEIQLVEKDLISYVDLQSVKEKRTDYERKMELLYKYLWIGGPDSLQQFCKALKHAGNRHLAELLANRIREPKFIAEPTTVLVQRQSSQRSYDFADDGSDVLSSTASSRCSVSSEQYFCYVCIYMSSKYWETWNVKKRRIKLTIAAYLQIPFEKIKFIPVLEECRKGTERQLLIEIDFDDETEVDLYFLEATPELIKQQERMLIRNLARRYKISRRKIKLKVMGRGSCFVKLFLPGDAVMQLLIDSVEDLDALSFLELGTGPVWVGIGSLPPFSPSILNVPQSFISRMQLLKAKTAVLSQRLPSVKGRINSCFLLLDKISSGVSLSCEKCQTQLTARKNEIAQTMNGFSDLNSSLDEITESLQLLDGRRKQFIESKKAMSEINSACLRKLRNAVKTVRSFGEKQPHIFIHYEKSFRSASVRSSKQRSRSSLSLISTDSGVVESFPQPTRPSDIYIHYGTVNESAAFNLFVTLRQFFPHREVLFDKKSIEWGGDVMKFIQANLAATRLAVVLISDAYLQSLQVDSCLQLNSLLQRQTQREQTLILPVFIGAVSEDLIKAKLPLVASLQAKHVHPDVEGAIDFASVCNHLESLLPAADADGSRISFMGGAPPVPQHCNRDQTLIDLSAWLQDSSENHLLTFIHGLPGIGKSLVAKLFYHRAKQLHWKVVYVGERHLQQSGSKEIADEIRLNASAGNVLIILDGFDHLIDLSPTACKALLYDCLRHAKKILVTSRSHFSVVELNPNVINLPPLEQSETEEYIIKMFSTIEGAEATSLASYSYGHPMLLSHFIELIKRNVFTPRELAAEVVAAGFRDLWTFLNRTLTTATANEDRLWYVFEHCFSAFGDDRTAKMARIAVFPQTFTAKAAKAITGDDSIAMFMADRSLLTRVSGGRLEMAHSLKSFLRHVAKTKYLQTYSNAKVRYYSYYIGLILKLSNMLSKCARHVLSEFEADKHNFEFVLGCNTIPLELHGDFMNMVLRANLLLKFCWLQDDLVKLYERCVDLATNREQMTVKARLEILLADQYVCCGRADEAVCLLEQAKKVFKSGDKDAYVLALASCYATLGSAHRCRGSLEQALMNLFKAKELYDNNPSLRCDSECRECRVSVLHALGVTFAHLNLNSKALTWFKRAQAECQMLGQPIEAKPEGSQRRRCMLGVHPYMADIYLNMAEAASASGNYKEGVDSLQKLRTIQEKLGFDVVVPAQVTYTKGVIGYLAGGAGRDAGIQDMEKAFRVSRGLLRFFIGFILGKIRYGQKEFAAAFSYFRAAKSAADEIAYKGYGYNEALAYGCISAKVDGNTEATSFYEELRRCFSHQSKGELDRILAPVLNVMNGSIILPKALICCWFYNRFCCHHRCLAEAFSTSGLSKFPFSDLGRAKFRFSVTLDQTQIRQEAQRAPESPTFAYGLDELIDENEIAPLVLSSKFPSFSETDLARVKGELKDKGIE